MITDRHHPTTTSRSLVTNFGTLLIGYFTQQRGVKTVSNSARPERGEKPPAPATATATEPAPTTSYNFNHDVDLPCTLGSALSTKNFDDFYKLFASLSSNIVPTRDRLLSPILTKLTKRKVVRPVNPYGVGFINYSAIHGDLPLGFYAHKYNLRPRTRTRTRLRGSSSSSSLWPSLLLGHGHWHGHWHLTPKSQNLGTG